MDLTEAPAANTCLMGSAKIEESSAVVRNALACAAIVGLSLLATYPVAEMGYVDDWSYVKSALDFARTGHLMYNGWATAMQGWQIAWIGLFIKLFGFSFTVARLSALPIAMASVALFHLILSRFGLSQRLAAFGALTLGLSPLFVPLATSLMTDVPGLFVVLLCLFMCQRAVVAESDRRAILWLLFAALLNVAGGTVRQIAWLGALVMVPSAGWLLRKRRKMLPAAIAIWVFSVLGIFGSVLWFSRQPYSVSEEAVVSNPLHLATIPHIGVTLLKAILCLMLVVLPVLIAWLPGVSALGAKSRIRYLACMGVLLALSVYIGIHGGIHPPREDELMPWIFHVISAQGIISVRSGDILGARPVVLGIWMRLAISLVVVAAGLAFAEWVAGHRGRWKASPPGECLSSWRVTAWLLGPFTASYLCLLLPRLIRLLIFDRYLLPLMAVAIVALLKVYQQEKRSRPAWVSWAALLLFAIFTVASTHDQFALDRARVSAGDEVLASGIPRTEIEGGFEYDGWTQIENGGHVNSWYIRVPKGAYTMNVPLLPLAPQCQLWASILFPSVRPRYFVTLEPMDCLAPSIFPAVSYRAWLPPWSGRVYIQESPNSGH